MKKNLLPRLLQASLMCCLAVLFTACDEIFGNEDYPVPAYLSINEKPVTIKVGETFQRQALTASRAVVEYSSSDAAVATVDATGTVKGVAAGTATITASVTGKNVDGKGTFLPDKKSYVVTVTGGSPSLIAPPLTFEAKTAGAVVTFIASNVAIAKDIEYSTDGGATWTAGNTKNPGVSVTLTNVGDKVMFRGTNDSYADASYYNKFTCSADCYVYGNVMSLINKDNYATNKELTATYAFRYLFVNNDKIFSHDTKTLELPATTLTSDCYRYMFEHCTALTTAPELPATTLADNCYLAMFRYCDALTTAPALPATEMKNGCYSFMFSSCTALTTAPNLPATTLANSCYYRMFESCTGLTTTQEELPVTTLKEACYKFMFDGCTALTKAPKLPATTLVKECYWGMFNGCTSLNEAWVAADYTITYPITDACWNIFTGCYNGTSPKGTLHTATTSNAWIAGTDMPANWLISKDYN